MSYVLSVSRLFEQLINMFTTCTFWYDCSNSTEAEKRYILNDEPKQWRLRSYYQAKYPILLRQTDTPICKWRFSKMTPFCWRMDRTLGSPQETVHLKEKKPIPLDFKSKNVYRYRFQVFHSALPYWMSLKFSSSCLLNREWGDYHRNNYKGQTLEYYIVSQRVHQLIVPFVHWQKRTNILVTESQLNDQVYSFLQATPLKPKIRL